MHDDEYYPREMYDHEIALNAKIVVGWSQEAVIQAVIKQVADRVYDEIKPQAVKAVSTALDDLANKAMTEIFDSEIQPTDRWGKPQGTPISVRAMLQRDTETWLTDNVDHNGRRGSDAYGKKLPRIHWLFQDAINGDRDRRGKTKLHKMIVESIKAVIGDVQGVIDDTVRARVKETLKIK